MAGFGDVAGAPCEDKRTAGYLNTNQEGRIIFMSSNLCGVGADRRTGQ